MKKNRTQGRVQVQTDKKGYLTFQLPMIYAQYYYNGAKQKYISFGAKYTEENEALAMTAAVEMQKALEAEKFNPDNISIYKHSSKRIKGQYQQKTEGSFGVLDLYLDFEKNLNVCATTRKAKYGCYRNHIKKMESSYGYTLKQQLEIKAWIQSNPAPTIALDMLSLFHRMIEWGKREERLPDTFISKFKAYSTEFKRSLRTVNTKRKSPKSVEDLVAPEGIKAWSEEERDIIIAAFYDQKVITNKIEKSGYIAPLIDFLFNVGCRHGEAFALTWSDISNNFTHVNISESYSSNSRILKGTKTGKTRLTPLNSRMQEMLRNFKSVDASPGDLIFKQKKGGRLNSRCIAHYWNPSGKTSIIGNLIREGKLYKYYDAYSTRRTFVSVQISRGASIVDVAYWVGDDPATILKHYARHNNKTFPY